MGLFLGWPIHRARSAPEEAPVLGQRQAGAACFPRQSTNAPERGAWRPWRAQLAPVQPPPTAAASRPPPPGPPPYRAPGPRSATPSPARPERRSSPNAARSAHAGRLPSFFSPPSHLLLCFYCFDPLQYLPHLSTSLPPFPCFSLPLPLIPTLDRPFCTHNLLLDPSLTLHCGSSPPCVCGLLRAPVPQCPPHLTFSGSAPGWPRGRKDGSRGKGLLFLAGTRAALVSLGFPCSSP